MKTKNAYAFVSRVVAAFCAICPVCLAVRKEIGHILQLLSQLACAAFPKARRRPVWCLLL